jgi:hypothetical protein
VLSEVLSVTLSETLKSEKLQKKVSKLRLQVSGFAAGVLAAW